MPGIPGIGQPSLDFLFHMLIHFLPDVPRRDQERLSRIEGSPLLERKAH